METLTSEEVESYRTYLIERLRKALPKHNVDVVPLSETEALPVYAPDEAKREYAAHILVNNRVLLSDPLKTGKRSKAVIFLDVAALAKRLPGVTEDHLIMPLVAFIKEQLEKDPQQHHRFR